MTTYMLTGEKWAERAAKARKTAGLTKLLKDDAAGWIISSVRTICGVVDLDDAEMRRHIANVLLGIQLGRVEQATTHGRWDAAGMAELGAGDQEWPSKHRALLECFGLDPNITIEGENAWGCMVVDEEAVRAIAKAKAEADKVRKDAYEASKGQWISWAIQQQGGDEPDAEAMRKLVGTTIDYTVGEGWSVKVPGVDEPITGADVEQTMGPICKAIAFGMLAMSASHGTVVEGPTMPKAEGS